MGFIRRLLDYVSAICCIYATTTHGLVPAPTRGLCLDFCAKSIEGLGKHDQDYFATQCSSYLVTTVAATIITTTSTATLTMISNNVDHNPTLQKPGATQTDKGPNGLLTIYPKDLPIHPFHWPACTTLKGADKEAYKAQVSSVCSCSGIEPRTTGGPTFTSTATKEIPTTASHFKLKALFRNGNTAYLEPKNISDPAIELAVGKQEKWVIAFNATQNGSALFELTNDKYLMVESKIAGKSHNLLGAPTEVQNAVRGNEVLGQIMGVLEEGKGEKGYSPMFYINMRDYSLALDEKIPSGIKYYSVAWKDGSDSFLMLATEEVAQKSPGIHEPVGIYAELVF